MVSETNMAGAPSVGALSGVADAQALTPAPPSALPRQEQRRGGPFIPLRHRNFSLLFSGQVISMLGDQAYGLALPWTVLTATGDPRQMSVVLAAGAVPRVLMLLLGGALADRLSPRLVMLVADLGRMLVVGALGVALFWGLPPLWLLALLAGLEGAGTGLFQPGVQALLPTTVPSDELVAGNGLMMIIQFLSLTLGPLLGGVATAAQASVAFLVDGASFGLSALTLFGIRLPRKTHEAIAAESSRITAHPTPTLETTQPARIGMFSAIGAGFRYSFSVPLLRVLMAMTLLGNFAFAGAMNVGLIVLARALSPSPVTLGVILAALGVGGVIGGLSAGLLGRRARRGVITLGIWCVISLLMIAAPFFAGRASGLPLLIALAPRWQVPAVAGVLGLLALLLALTDTTLTTVMQQKIAPEYLARVFSIQFLAGGILQPISLILAGYIVTIAGSGVVFIGAGVALLGLTAIGLASRDMRQL